MEEILNTQNIVSKTCFFSGRGRKQNRQVHLAFEIVGPACQNIARNHHIRRQKKIACSYSDPGGTLKKIKQPLLAATKSVNFGSEGRLETKPTENQYACKWQKSNLLNQNLEPSRV